MTESELAPALQNLKMASMNLILPVANCVKDANQSDPLQKHGEKTVDSTVNSSWHGGEFEQ